MQRVSSAFMFQSRDSRSVPLRNLDLHRRPKCQRYVLEIIFSPALKSLKAKTPKPLGISCIAHLVINVLLTCFATPLLVSAPLPVECLTLATAVFALVAFPTSFQCHCDPIVARTAGHWSLRPKRCSRSPTISLTLSIKHIQPKSCRGEGGNACNVKSKKSR